MRPVVEAHRCYRSQDLRKTLNRVGGVLFCHMIPLQRQLGAMGHGPRHDAKLLLGWDAVQV